MRNILYKVNLILSNGKELPITVAARGKERLWELVEKNKVLYNREGYSVERFRFVEELPTIQMPEEKYQEELAFCDIVDED